MDIDAIHAAACVAGERSYRDPMTGFQVFTSLGLEARGTCCGSRCRHCPFDHVNVPEDAEGPATRLLSDSH